MLHDVLLIKDWHLVVTQTIVKALKDKLKSKDVITISGESGSGKSELAHLICKNLGGEGLTAKNISADNFYKISPKNRNEYRKKYGAEKVVGYDEYDWNSLSSLLSKFKNGEKAELPCIDLITQEVDALYTNFSNIDILVIDGLYAIKLNSDYRVFIDITYEKTKKAQISRGKEKLDDFRLKVLQEEHKHVSKLKALANVIINEDHTVSFLI